MDHTRVNAWVWALAMAGIVYGQDIDISGRVEDASGAGLAGASVWLAKQNMRTTTGSDGMYRFLRLAVARPAVRQATCGVPAIAGGRLQVQVRDRQTRVRVEAFDLRGRLAAPVIDEVLGPGSYEYALPLEHGAMQARFLRVQVGSERHILGCMGQAVRPAAERVPATAAAAGQAKATEGAAALAIDTLQISLAGYVTRTVLVASYSQYLVTRLELDSGLAFSINHGDLFVVKDTCVLVVRDAQRALTAVRFTDSVAAGVPVFGLATSRNSASLHAVSDTLLEVTWVLTKGASGKTVYAERTFTDNHVDTVYDGILVRPWHVAVTLRNDTSGPGQTMRRVGEALVSGTGLVPSVCIYRPWVDFSVDIGGDSSFALDFGAWLLVPQSQWTLDSTSPLLRTGRLSCALSGSGAAHDPSRVYHYSFHPDSADGAANIDTLVLFRKTTTPPYETVLSTLAPVSPRRNYDTLCHLSGSDRLAVGRKEMALVLSFHGRYFDDARTVTVSPRLDHSSPFVLCYDAYPPSVHRDFWEYVYPADGAVIDSLFTINLNATGEVYDSSGNQLLQRGLVWDKGGADITGIDLILAEMSDETAARWTSDTMWNKTTLSDLLSVRHYRFGFPIPVPGPQVYPVAWYDIDPSQWNDGWYYVAIVTTDSYGNRDIAPFYAGWGKDYLITHNPQHWRIVTPYHTF